jgi:hypothetical protein
MADNVHFVAAGLPLQNEGLMSMQKIPATVITGFLGAGKTTMIRNLLENAEGEDRPDHQRVRRSRRRRRGAEGVRHRELRRGRYRRTEQWLHLLHGGRRLHPDDGKAAGARGPAGSYRHRDLGARLPQPLVAAFNWPGIKTAVTVDGVVTVVDSHHELHHADGHEHDHDEFESFAVELGPVSDASAFAEGLKALIVTHDILRLKGFADMPGKPMRMVVQAVGSRIDTHFDRPWASGEARETRLVVIGLHDIDEAAIRASLATLAG